MKTKQAIKHILVIDDDEFLLHAIKKKLELATYKVTVSTNVQDAYFKLNMMKPDLILLDIIMPDISGIAFMNLVNSQLMTLNVPVILMSSLAEEDVYKMGYNIGQAQYLHKPFDVNSLPLILEQSIQKL